MGEDKRRSNGRNYEKLFKGVAKLDCIVLGLASGLLCGLSLFVATNWLVIRGGENVGAHLRLLGQFFIGYSVTFGGSFVGLAYGFVSGAAAGALVGWIYNKIAAIRQ